ncbi:MAG TPA: glycosyltransferase [Ktedonobacterales bacterium]|nr:glycosyltransferase [Ktedonobacterales bacterium]
MRTAIIAGEFPKVSETFVLHHINGLLRRGLDVDVFSEFRPRGSEFAHDDALAASMLARTSYVDLPSLKSGKRLLTAPQRVAYCARVAPRLTLDMLNPAQFGRYAIGLSQVNRLYALAQARRPYDVIHAHFGMVGDRFRFASALWHAPLVVSFHGYDVNIWPQQHGRDCYDRLFKAAAAITANSENTRKRIIELGCPPDKVDKVYPAWDMANFPFTVHGRDEEQPMRVLTVARLVEIKGVEDGIKAMALLRKANSNVHYDVVGDGPLREQLQALIDSLDLREIVTLHGARPRDYVQRMMQDAHVFLLSSAKTQVGAQEGFGVVLLEAQAAGLPVVATEHGAFPEVVVHGETGFLAPEHSPEQLAHWLAFLMEHPQTAMQMGRVAREHVERNFAPADIDARCVQLYQHVIATYREAHREKTQRRPVVA